MRVFLTGAAVVVLVCGIFLIRPNPVAKVDDKICDVLTSSVSRGQPSGQVTIVEIDETSLTEMGRWPWPRDLLGMVVARILDRGAATVVLDMLLHDEDRGVPSVPASGEKVASRTNDEVLAGVIEGKPVVTGYAFRFDAPPTSAPACAPKPFPLAVVGQGELWGSGFFHATGALCSVPLLAKAAAASGFLNAAPDSDGKLRRVPVVMESGDRQYPSLALAAVGVYRRGSAIELALNGRERSQLRIGNEVVRLEDRSSMRLRFRGARRTFPYVAAADVLNNRVPTDALKGRIVLVGGSALGLPNAVVTPVDSLFPDLEVEATAIDNLLQGDSFYRPAGLHSWELGLALFAGLGTAFLLVQIRSWWSPVIVLGIAASAWAGCTLLLSTAGLLLSPLPAIAALACQFPVVTLINYLLEKRRADQATGQLESVEEYTRGVLRESESRYERLVENINDAIIVADAEGKLVFANRRFREWFGLTGTDIRGVPQEDHVAAEWRDRLRDQLRLRLSGGNAPDQYEYEGIRPDGTRIWIEALVTNVEEDGRIVGTQAALRDLTERKKIETQYLQAQKMESVGRLAGGIAHDFNNLLTVINGYSELLLSRMPDASQDRASLMQIRGAGERATELTRNLLAFSRKQLVQPKDLDLNVVIGEARTMFGRLIGEDIELITELSPELGQVVADPGQLHQILMNLLVNARDAMPHGGKVVIETRTIQVDQDFARLHPGFETGSYVCLRVTDNGAGMNDEVKQHLFEPFFTTKEPGKGTGLGLATIYGIVRQSGGKIEVTSKADEGTTFLIYLPCVNPVGLAQPGSQDPAARLQGSETVLVVEDQDAVRHYIRTVLEDSGYRVLLAADGPSALTQAEQFPGIIHLLLTDVVLPLMNGRDLAEKMKMQRPEMKVLYTSGYAEETIGKRGIIANDLAYLPKPFGPERLTARVREVLAHPVDTWWTARASGQDPPS
jgi:PAS domain S-box-containing protein